MAKSNTLVYQFMGDTTNLEEALRRARKAFNKSIRQFKEAQDGQLDETQKTQKKTAKGYLETITSLTSSGKKLSKDEVETLQKNVKAYLKLVERMQRNANNIVDKYRKKQDKQTAKQDKANAEKQTELDKMMTPAGRALMTIKSQELLSLAPNLKGYVRDSEINNLVDAIVNYQSALEALNDAEKDATATEEERNMATANLRTSTEKLMDYDDQYAELLSRLKSRQSMFNNSITDLNSLFKALNNRLQNAVSSLDFWLSLLRKAFSIIKEGVSSYSDYVESLNFLTEATGECSDALKEFTDAQAQAFGLDPTEINTAAATFYTLANSLGLTASQSQLVSENMTKLAQDMASLHNVTVEEAMTKLRSALAGQSKALSVWGINVSDASVEQWLLTKGINASMSSMNEATQAAARYAFIIAKSASAQGDLSRTIQSPANQMKIFSTQVSLLKQNLGSLFTNILMPMLKIVNPILQALNAFGKALTSLSASSFSSSVGSQLEDITDDAEDASDAFSGLTDLDEINTTSSSSSNIGESVESQIAAILEGYDNLSDQTGHLTEVFTALGEAMAPIWSMFNNSSSFSIISAAFEGLGIILTPVKLALEGISWLFQQMPEPLQQVVGVLSELALALAEITIAIAAIKALGSLSLIKNFISILGKMLLSIKSITVQLWKKITAQKTDVALSLKDNLVKKQSILQSTKQRIANWWETASWWAKATAIAASMAALGLLTAAAVVAVVATMNSLNSNSSRSSNVTGLAKGGVVTGPTLAMVGEGKYPEAVVPLGNSPQFASMQDTLAEVVVSAIQGNGSSRSSGSTPVTINIDGRTIAKALWPSLAATQSQVGVKIK